MADRLFEVMSRPVLRAQSNALLRLDPLRNERKPEAISFSGGVSDISTGASARLRRSGPALARAILERVKAWDRVSSLPTKGSARRSSALSQYTVQVSGSTIFVAPQTVLPLRNVPVVTPNLPLDDETLAVERISESVGAALRDSISTTASGRWPFATVGGLGDVRAIGCLLPGNVSGLANELGRGLPLILVETATSGD